MENDVSVVSLAKRFIKLERGIENAARFFLVALSEKKVSVEIYLVGERRMKKINRTHRGKNNSTNVLSFEVPNDFPKPDGEKKDLGEIYICPNYIRKHNENLEHMLLHGILHLLGFNHQNKSDRIRMEKVEEKLVKQWLNSRS